MSFASWQPASPTIAPIGFDQEQLFSGIWWHQRWEMFHGIFTPGRNPVSQLCDYVGLPQDLRGLRVLDIGAWHGCFSFECERRGAAEVVALSLEDPNATAFYKIRDAIKSKVVRYELASVYDLNQEQLGLFDVVLFMGVLYHLRYPLLAIDKIRQVSHGVVLTETHVIDNHFIIRGEGGASVCNLEQVSPAMTAMPLWRFYKDDELNKGDWSNWFGPNIRGVLEAFETSGFEIELLTTWGDRAAFRAVPKTSLSDSFKKTYEGDSPVNRRLIGLEP